jgi:hypothetical protein
LQAVDDDGNTATAAPKAKPSIDNERFEKALHAIAGKKFTVEQLQATYSLTDLQVKAIAL